MVNTGDYIFESGRLFLIKKIISEYRNRIIAEVFDLDANVSGTKLIRSEFAADPRDIVIWKQKNIKFDSLNKGIDIENVD
jgi:hypothetical protein